MQNALEKKNHPTKFQALSSQRWPDLVYLGKKKKNPCEVGTINGQWHVAMQKVRGIY